MNKFFFLVLFILTQLFSLNTYSQYLPNDLLSNIKESNNYISVSVARNDYTDRYLKSEGFKIENSTKNWFFLFLKGKDYYKLLLSEIARFVYFDFSEPQMLNDSSRVMHKVNEVHNGVQLPAKYTGQNVVMGIIDSGIDFLHDDFKDSTGKTRVYRYWDQSDKSNINSPKPYNYGFVWTKKDIDNGICTAVDNSGHGTNVSGIASGNGRANGKNKGIAPNSIIIMVETNLSAPSWTLTVADACDYIFKVADSLGLPAVINISNGVQFGSHDGTDPASEKIETLLDEKPGRVLVASAGNSGSAGKYHVHVDVDNDTSFYWVKPSINGIAGVNTVYVDMWADSIDFSDVMIGTGANLNSGSYAFRGSTTFRNFKDIYSKSPAPFRDTLFSKSGYRLAFVDYYASIVNKVARIEWVLTSIDSSNYYYQFRTTGKGSFDGWSGELNKRSNGKTYTDFITSNLPSSVILPQIKDYVLADTLQTIFSSYISSEKVVTVGNISNRSSFKAKDGNTYFSNFPTGKIFSSSSKGPNRKNIVKPDISASGNFTLSAAPLYLLNDPSKSNKIDEGGMHYLNGGTSMSSPVIAGIAALYLEKCSNATYQDFKNELIKAASSNEFTEILPNFAYGYGIADAFKLLNNSNNSFVNTGDSVIYCGKEAIVKIQGKDNIQSIIWEDFSSSTVKKILNEGYYSFTSKDFKGCISKDYIKIGVNNTKPTILIQSSKGTILDCNQSTLVLKAKGGDNYLWTGTISSNFDSIIVDKPGKYLVTSYINTQCESKDSIEINIDTIKPKIKINTIGINSISCLNDPVKLVASGAEKFIWDGGSFLSSDTNLILLPGKYRVLGTSKNNCKNSDSIIITKDPNPNVLIINNSASQFITCKQKNIDLSSYGALTYTWNKGLNLTGNVNRIIDSGMVVLTGIDSKGCKGVDSILISVDTLKPNLELQFIGSTSISCNNDPVVVQANGAVFYEWNGGIKPNSSKNLFNIPGKYIVKALNLNGCFSIDSISLIKNNYPPIPIIDFKDSILTASKSLNYQWYKDGLELKNDTLQTLSIKENGIYMVAVNLNGCVSTSSYLKTNLSVDETYETSYFIYPNPLITNRFEIKNLKQNSTVLIRDLSGKNIDYEQVGINVFEIKNINSGIYFISISDSVNNITFKIFKI